MQRFKFLAELGTKFRAQQSGYTLTDLWQADPQREQKYSIQVGPIYYNFAKQLINDQIIEQLINLAEQAELRAKLADLFNGRYQNPSENRWVGHTLLRGSATTAASNDIAAQMAKMRAFAEQLDPKFTDLLCLGIGGSNLGPKLLWQALQTAGPKSNKPQCHFIANTDQHTLNQTLKQLKPGNTLVIISSKTFTTLETLTTAEACLTWLQEHDCPLAEHLVAVTSAPERALAFGVKAEQVFEFWYWVGGRFSIWSAVALPIVLALGYECFEQFLQGAAAIDQHVATAPWRENLAVMMALIGIWNINGLNYNSLAVIPYLDRLGLLPAYLQQLEMESNGKSRNQAGELIDYATAPIIWGGVGCDNQHSYMQLLHQGQQIVPVDFIAFQHNWRHNKQDKILLLSCLAQSWALAFGNMVDKDKTALNNAQLNGRDQHQLCLGNRPSSLLISSELSAYTLGMLIAIFEHKVFVQGVLWQIPSFDQWGVQLGKQLINQALQQPDSNLLAIINSIHS